MIPDAIRAEILGRIRAAEAEHDIRVLLAVESGSRAWGFASPDSDYDVRFIYARPRHWYLSIELEGNRDVVEYAITDDIDLNGWDVRKALRLFSKSNPTFVEWIQSPVVYVETGAFARQARELLREIYSPDAGIHHYRSMARTNFRPVDQAEMVRLKKYFYVLRPLLAGRWLERYGTAAPIEFEKLLPLLDDDKELLADINALLGQKRLTPELGLAPPVQSINAFIKKEFERIDKSALPTEASSQDLSRLNDVFRSVLDEGRSDEGP